MMNRSVPSNLMVAHFSYRDVSQACEWLTRVFGLAEHFRYGGGPDGIQMRFGDAVVMLHTLRGSSQTPAESGCVMQSLTLFPADVTVHFERAQREGAPIVEGLRETVYGEFQYDAEDLAGYRWSFSQHARDLSPDSWGAVMHHS